MRWTRKHSVGMCQVRSLARSLPSEQKEKKCKTTTLKMYTEFSTDAHDTMYK